MIPEEKEPLDELTREIRKVILDNRKFLGRIMDEDLEVEEEDEITADDLIEL